MWRRHVLLIVLLATVSAERAAAQANPNVNQWARGTELGVGIGGATASSTTGPMFTGMVGWELTRWVAIEGRGSWFARGSGAEAFGADVGAVANLRPRRAITPFVGAGYGLYRASFDSAGGRMSPFYRDRMMEPRMPLADSISFTDPAVRVSAGVDVIVRRHLTIRPEASVIFVHRGGGGDTLATFGFRVGYRFEDHPITPARRPLP